MIAIPSVVEMDSHDRYPVKNARVAGSPLRRQCCSTHLVGDCWKRVEANMIASPARTLEGRAFSPAGGAACAGEASGPHKMTATAHASGA
jgi:hypothetical protein